jgi:hypothetical protein
MSILNAINRNTQNKKDIKELAKLPQALIMQMGQRKELTPEEVALVTNAKAEMIDQTAKQAALAQGGGQMPSIIEQDMAKVAQAENPAPPMPQGMPPQQLASNQTGQAPMPQGPADVGIATQATKPMQLAGGGIIAFDNGGDVDSDEDYEEARDDAHELAMNHAIYNAINAGRSGHGAVGIKSGENKHIKEDTRERVAEHVSDADQARKHNVGNLRPSGFSYPGQVGTSKGGFAMFDTPESGVKALHHDIGIKLNRGLDTPTKFISVYAPAGDKNDVGAYSGNVAKMLGIGPNDKIPNTPEARQMLANAIIRQEGAHKATAAFAGGGEIKHYYAGGYEDEYSPEGTLISGPNTRSGDEYVFDTGYLNPNYKPFNEKEWEKKYGKKPKTSPKNTESAPIAPPPPPSGDKPQFDNVPGIANKAKEEQFNMMDYIKSREAKMDKAAEKDYAMAGLAAGLGMLGGTSQYAFENIGKGGQMGVQQLANSQKMRASQEAALGKLYGSASQYDLLNKTRQDALAEKQKEHNEKLALASNEKLNKAIADAKKAPQNASNLSMLNALEAQFAAGKLDPSKIAELNRLRQINQDIENSVRKNFSGNTDGFSARKIGQ